ncbi:MAG: CDGSH iron-sulfur domain-containing protein [Alistipes sp.]
MSKLNIEPGSSPAKAQFNITVTDKGPYLVYGRPPLAEQFIMPDEKDESWYFQEGLSFSTEAEPTALCRCGSSNRKPYCDGTHTKANWNPTLTASTDEALMDQVEVFEGEEISMVDNEKYCSFARFCHPHGDAWNLIGRSANNPEVKRLVMREVSMCPSGRLTIRDNKSNQPHELPFEPSLGLIEDVTIGASGGLWIRGGIPMNREDGHTYEIRNRVVVCRCGQSANKPYCDGTHAAIKWRDHLEGKPLGTTLPEPVY